MDNGLTEKLVALTERTGYPLVQENGQRKYGPKPGAAVPVRGSEVFIGKLPRDCFEDELVPVFAEVGEIYEMRMLMDFSGTNRGYGFIMYESPLVAQLAIQKLHGYEIRPGYKLGLVPSIDNRRLYIGNVPRNATSQEILKEIELLVAFRVVDITIYNDNIHKHRNRGYVFVEFESHRAASKARRTLVSSLHMQGRQLKVDWAAPEPHVPEHIMKREAVNTMNKMNGIVIDNQLIEAKWAKPISRQARKQNQSKDSSKHSYNTSASSDSVVSKESVVEPFEFALLHNQDLIAAPHNLYSMCIAYGLGKPYYSPNRYGLYWIVNVMLPAVGPDGTSIKAQSSHPCPTQLLANCFAACEMLNLLQEYLANGQLKHLDGTTVQIPLSPIRGYGI